MNLINAKNDEIERIKKEYLRKLLELNNLLKQESLSLSDFLKDKKDDEPSILLL